MKIIIKDNKAEGAQVAYAIVENIVKTVKNPVLGLATGATPLGLYNLMVKGCKAGLSYKHVATVNLDEYVGLGELNKESYVTFMRENLFNHIDIDLKNTKLPNGKATDPEAEAKRYSAQVVASPPDVQILGIGSNGHIGFNEPAPYFIKDANVVTLKDSTRRDNACYFDSLASVPTRAITMGIGDIMLAKSVIIMAFGAGKATAVKAMVNGNIDPMCPASILQLHPNVTVILDRESASLLR